MWKSEKKNENAICVFCKRNTIDNSQYGQMESTKTITAHYYCVLLSHSIKQSGLDNQGIWGFKYTDIKNELKLVENVRCIYCKQLGANLACAHKSCKRRFHLPCGVENGYLPDFKNFVVYCSLHRAPINVPTTVKHNINNHKCIVCMEYFTVQSDFSDIIWADCCQRDVLLHLNCAREVAKNSGYYTRCPACNNSDTFVDTLKTLGVFVPDRDASWEINGSGYAGLYYTHNTCDIQPCLCPTGRTTNSKRWSVTLCHYCGSFGAHSQCGNFADGYACNTCSKITKEINKEEPTEINDNEVKIVDSPASPVPTRIRVRIPYEINQLVDWENYFDDNDKDDTKLKLQAANLKAEHSNQRKSQIQNDYIIKKNSFNTEKSLNTNNIIDLTSDDDDTTPKSNGIDIDSIGLYELFKTSSQCDSNFSMSRVAVLDASDEIEFINSQDGDVQKYSSPTVNIIEHTNVSSSLPEGTEFEYEPDSDDELCYYDKYILRHKRRRTSIDYFNLPSYSKDN